MIKHWCGEWFMKTYPLRCCKCWASVTKPVARMRREKCPSLRSRGNYCKIRKCWDVTALVLVTRLIVCRRQTDRQADWRLREQTRLSLGSSHFCQESRMPNQIQIGSRHDGPLIASVSRSDMVQVPFTQINERSDRKTDIHTMCNLHYKPR